MKIVKLIIKIVIILGMLILSGYLLNTVLTLNVLPNKYLYLLIGGVVVLNLLGAVCILVRKIWPKFIAVIMYLPLVIISIVGIKVGTSANEFLDEAFDNYKIETTVYHLMVKADGKYKTLEDLAGKDINYFTFYNDTDKIVEEINKLVSNAVLTPRDDLYDGFINFLVGQLSAIVIDDGYLEVLGEDYKDLDSRLKELATFTIETKVKEGEETTKPTIPSNYDQINKGDSLNIYLSGSDSRSNEIYNKTRTDVNMVLSINPHTRTILLTSIPRDYYVQVHGQTGLKDKLTHSGIYGLSVSKDTVADLFNVEMDYAIKVGFSSVVELVDLVGGIEVYSDTEFDSYHIPGWHVVKGMNQMDGKKALAYARERYAYAGGDRHRILNQQQVLEATLTKIMSNKSLLLKYDSLLKTLSKFYITDIPRDVISSYVKMQLDTMGKWTFISQSVDGKGSMEHTHVTPNSNLYVMIPNEDSVMQARLKMKEVLEAR